MGRVAIHSLRQVRWTLRGDDQFDFVQKDFGVSTGSLCRGSQQAGGHVKILVARDLGLMEVMAAGEGVGEIEGMGRQGRLAGQRSR